MSTDVNARPGTEVLFGVTVVTAGLGVLTLALFPLALPILVLTGVLFVPLLPLVLAAALVAGLVVSLRAIWRRVARVGRRPAVPRRREARRPRADLGSLSTSAAGRASARRHS